MNRRSEVGAQSREKSQRVLRQEGAVGWGEPFLPSWGPGREGPLLRSSAAQQAHGDGSLPSPLLPRRHLQLGPGDSP